MNPSEKIKQLNSEILKLQIEIKNCKHIFGKTKYDPDTVLEGYGSIQDGAGSDPHWSYAGYRNKEVARWSRTCSECGYTEYTKKQGPIEPTIQKFEPKFG